MVHRPSFTASRIALGALLAGAVALLALLAVTVVRPGSAQGALEGEIAPPATIEAPRAGIALTVFPDRDMVSVESSSRLAGDHNFDLGDTVVVQVRRGAEVTAQAAVEVVDPMVSDDPDGIVGDTVTAIEVNHPGNECWGATAGGDLIRPGDRVIAFEADSDRADATTVAGVSVSDYPRILKDSNGHAIVSGGRYAVTLRGTSAVPPGEIEAQLLNTTRYSTGRRDLRADVNGGDPDAFGGTLVANGDQWTATWRLNRDDAIKALAADPSVTWLGGVPVEPPPVDAGEQSTISEYLAEPEGCGAGDPVQLAPLATSAPTEPDSIAPGREIGVFPSREYVSAEGFRAGERVAIEVLRDGHVIASALGLVPDGDDPDTPAGEGLVEVNHVGAACWSDAALDIRPLDQVRVRTRNAAGNLVDVSTMTVQDAAITAEPVDPALEPLPPTAGESRVATDEGGGLWTVTVSGYARNLDGSALTDGSAGSEDQLPLLEMRLRNKAFRALPGMNDKQDLRAGAAEPAVGRVLTYAPVDVHGNEVMRWTATYSGLSEAIKNVAMRGDTEQMILWLGADGLALTDMEFGPGAAPGAQCSPPPGAGDPGRDTLVDAPVDPGTGGGGGTPGTGGGTPGTGGGPGTPTTLPPGAVLVPGPNGPTPVTDPVTGAIVLRVQVDAASLARLTRTGVLTVIVRQRPRPSGTLYRFRIRRVRGGARAAAATAPSRPAAARPVAVLWRKAPRTAGRHRITLRSRALKGLARGRYMIEVQSASRRHYRFGPIARVTFRVR